MTQVFISHIDLTLPVAIIKENGRQNRLNRENAILDHNLEVLQTVFLKIRYQHSKIPKRFFNILCTLLLFIIHLNIFLVFACALCYFAC